MKKSIPVILLIILFTIQGAVAQTLHLTDYADSTFVYTDNGISGVNQVLKFIAINDPANISSNTVDWFIRDGNINQQHVRADNDPIDLPGYPEFGRGTVLRISPDRSQASTATNLVEYNKRIGNAPGAQTLYLSMKVNMFRLNSYASNANRETFSIGFVEIVNDDVTPANTTSTKGVRLYARHLSATTTDRDGSFRFGIQKEGGAIVYDGDNTYVANGNNNGDSAIFVLIKVSMDGDNANNTDSVQLYSSKTVPANEPTTWGATTSDGTDMDLNGIFIKEKMTGSAQDHFMNFSGMRVADSWEALLGSFWNGSEWSIGEPTDSVNAIVSANLTLSSDLSVNSLIINTDDTVVVSAGASLSINKDLSNDGLAVVNSGGTLITYADNSVDAVEIRRNSSFTDAALRYSFIGSPVSGYNIDDLNSSFHFTYNTLDDSYSSFSGEMIPGVGYTSAGKQELVFSGIPVSGDINVPLSTEGNGFNFVANPYPAAISRTSFINANANISGAIYLWDDGGSNTGQRTGDDFITVTNAGTVGGSGGSGATVNGFIGSAQGFLVEASGSGDVIFRDSMRVLGNNLDANYFRKGQEDVQSIKLQLYNEEFSDETLVAFASFATEGYDKSWDANKLKGSGSLFLYTRMDTENMAIQTLPLNQTSNTQIKLGMEVPYDGKYYLSLDQEILQENKEVYLMDKLTQNMHRLSRTNSTALDLKMGDIDRFVLVITENSFSERLYDNALTMTVSTRDGYLKANFEAALEGTVTYSILDFSGNVIYAEEQISSGSNEWSENISLIPGSPYILKVQDDNGVRTNKFIF